MEHILEAGVDSNFMVYDGVALETIVSNWSKGVAIPMTRLLLKHGASFNIENALSLAIEREDRELIEMFLQYSSSTNLDRALHSAIKTKDRALIDLISQHGADPIAEIECTFGFVYKATALSVAAATGLWETQYILGLLASRNPYRLIAEYITADVLISAAAAGQYDTVCLLCRESPGVVANHFGITPLHAAICHGHLNICEFLISMYDEYTSDIVPTVTSLHVACYYWQEHIVRFLVRCGADVDAIARFSHTTEENNTVSRLLPAFNYSRRYTSKLYAVTPLDMIFANNKSFTTAAADCATVLINAGAKPSGREVDLAAMHAHLDLLSSCLAAGADPNKGHEDKCSALQVILSSSFLQWMSDVRWMRDRHYCFVELLLKSGAVLRGGEIISAIRLKMWDFVDLLLRYDGKLSDTDTSGTTALEEAIWSQYNPLITRIFETTPGIYDAGSLCAAMETQQKSIEQRLLANRCAESVGSDLEVTAIGIAAESGDFNLLRTLLEYLPPHRCGPLPICVFNMRHRYLLRFHRFGYYGKGSIHSLYGSPLALLAFSEENSAIEACFELLKAGFQPDRLTWVVASSSNNAPFIQFLLDHGQRYNEIGDDDSIDYRLESPLSYAVENHNKNLVEMLLRAGADVNEHIMEPCSRSPLQRAVELGDLDLVRYLTEAGANINSPSAYQFGATALQFAAIKGHIVIAKYLLDHGAEVNASPAEKGGRTALEGAAEMGRLDMLGLLLAKGAKKTGDDCHRHFIRAVKRAMKEGHYIAANLLKHSLGWSEEDEGMFQAVQLDDEGVIIE
ncbi:hypothetical protein RRF57_004069 [Xylaria bambusicola]|uniref:Ankyrin n=1 Tax=Xylaria bambusicola TaxID=326684 RepID=A0AAN7UVM4_9PEZI